MQGAKKQTVVLAFSSRTLHCCLPFSIVRGAVLLFMTYVVQTNRAIYRVQITLP
jgi:hypothetical protein